MLNDRKYIAVFQPSNHVFIVKVFGMCTRALTGVHDHAGGDIFHGHEAVGKYAFHFAHGTGGGIIRQNDSRPRCIRGKAITGKDAFRYVPFVPVFSKGFGFVVALAPIVGSFLAQHGLDFCDIEIYIVVGFTKVFKQRFFFSVVVELHFLLQVLYGSMPKNHRLGCQAPIVLFGMIEPQQVLVLGKFRLQVYRPVAGYNKNETCGILSPCFTNGLAMLGIPGGRGNAHEEACWVVLFLLVVAGFFLVSRHGQMQRIAIMVRFVCQFNVVRAIQQGGFFVCFFG